jgi:hypothetical protein
VNAQEAVQQIDAALSWFDAGYARERGPCHGRGDG